MNLEINTTISFEHLLDAKNRVTQHIGGTRSGKTYAILQYLITEGLQKNLTITIVRKTIPSLKRTVMKDFKDILNGLNLWRDENFNITDRVYKLYDSTVQFLSTDDADKLRGIKSDILFIDEASEIDEESYFQLSIRTTGRIILAFNPTISPYHWIRQMQDCDRYVTTYKDNVYLEPTIVKAIEDLETTSPKKWQIYGKGEYAPNEKAIFTFDICDTMEGEFVGFGLDWGYAGDELALVAVTKNGGNVYIEELIYEKGMVMNDIIAKLKSLDIQREEIWCDSSEPRSIEELCRSGFNAKAVKKGPDSIKFGISTMQNYKIHLIKKSQNLINEFYGYQWATDKYGYVTDTPEGGLDHLIDASRYVIMSKLSLKAQQKGVYSISIR